MKKILYLLIIVIGITIALILTLSQYKDNDASSVKTIDNSATNNINTNKATKPAATQEILVEQNKVQVKEIEKTKTQQDNTKAQVKKTTVQTNQTHEKYTANKDYIVLDKPVATSTGDKIEVLELFWYYCPTCYRLEPVIDNWIKTIPDNAEFVRYPALFNSKKWERGAMFYFVLKDLGLDKKLNKALFDAIHLHKINFTSKQDFIDWLISHGVDEQAANKSYDSFAVKINMNKAKINIRKYSINGVPAIVVNGKYLLDLNRAQGSPDTLFKIVDFLIKKESKK